jgi:hypothetical protein
VPRPSRSRKSCTDNTGTIEALMYVLEQLCRQQFVKTKTTFLSLAILCGAFLGGNETQAADAPGERAQLLLSGAGWQFSDASSNSTLPEIVKSINAGTFKSFKPR